MNKLIKPTDPEFMYADRMRAAFPLVGLDWFKFMAVEMKPGDNIKAHKHRHHLVLYYPGPAEAVVITPQPGTMLYLPPGTTHEVPPVKRDRFSIAMLIEDRPCK